MAKNFPSQNNDDGHDSNNKVGKNPPKQQASDKYTLRFKENRTYFLHVGREVIPFAPFEEKTVPLSVIAHKDFENARKNFVIKDPKGEAVPVFKKLNSLNTNKEG